MVKIVNNHLGLNDPTQIKTQSIDLNIIRSYATDISTTQVLGQNLCDLFADTCTNKVLTQQVN
jgi:hypothetical protein